tara:strand:+ start:4637 stop:4996 length:360 start_codon:yes stop_codon:yes gene_type:complete
MIVMDSTEELYTLIDRAIDEAMFNQRFMFKMYDYLKSSKWTRKATGELIDSSSMGELKQEVTDLNAYIKGGDTYIREAYHHIPKPKARKIRDYFQSMIDDASRYYDTRKPGRPRKRSTK